MFKIVLCLLSTILVAECALPNQISARADASLSNFLLNHQVRSTTPTSMQCFSIYVPLLNEASNQWAAAHDKCVKAAEVRRNNILAEASEHHKDIAIIAGDVCGYVQTCDSNVDSLLALDCFGDMSSNTVSTIYTVSNNASDRAADIRHQISLVDIDSYRCSNASEREYIERTGQIYTALNYCLENGLPTIVPQPTPVTVAPSPTTVDVNHIQLISAPRRTPALGLLSNEPQAPVAKPAPRSNLISVFNN